MWILLHEVKECMGNTNYAKGMRIRLLMCRDRVGVNEYLLTVACNVVVGRAGDRIHGLSGRSYALNTLISPGFCPLAEYSTGNLAM